MKKKNPRMLVLDAFIKHPEGLTISSLAKATGLHRHTSAKYLYELVGSGIVRQRKIGSAKLCYLKEKVDSKEKRKKILKSLERKWEIGEKSQARLITIMIIVGILSISSIVIASNISNQSLNISTTGTAVFQNITIEKNSSVGGNQNNETNETSQLLMNESKDYYTTTTITNNSLAQSSTQNISNNSEPISTLTYSEFGANSTYCIRGDAIEFHAFWRDEYGLDKWIFSWNASGNWENETHNFVTSYDDKTKVLTKDGWKYFRDLSFDDYIATFDGKKIEWQKPLRIVSSNYEGYIYEIDGNINLIVTKNHKLFAKVEDVLTHTLNKIKEFLFGRSFNDYHFISVEDTYKLSKKGYLITFLDRNFDPVIVNKIERRSYKGKIFDLTVPNHIILVKRYGKDVWSSNLNSVFGWSNITKVVNSTGLIAYRFYASDLNNNWNSTKIKTIYVKEKTNSNISNINKSFASSESGQSYLTIQTDKNDYLINEYVNISGNVSLNGESVNGTLLINVSFNNQVIRSNTTTVVNGVYHCSIGKLTDEGNYTIQAHFGTLENQTTFQVSRIKTEMNLTIKENVGEALLSADGNGIENKTIKFYLNNSFIGENVTNSEGLAYFNFSKLNVSGYYLIKARFEGDTFYKSIESSIFEFIRPNGPWMGITIECPSTIIRNNSILTINSYVQFYNTENVSFETKLPADFRILEDLSSCDNKTCFNVYRVQVNNASIGEKKIIAIANSIKINSTKEKTVRLFAISSLNISLEKKVYYNNENLSVKGKLILDNSTPIKNKTIKVYLNDTLIVENTTDVNGGFFFVIPLQSFPVGNYTVKFEFDGTDYILPSLNEFTINIKEQPYIIVYTNKSVYYFNETIHLWVNSNYENSTIRILSPSNKTVYLYYLVNKSSILDVRGLFVENGSYRVIGSVDSVENYTSFNFTVNITDREAPKISNETISKNLVYVEESVNLSASVYDNINVREVLFELQTPNKTINLTAEREGDIFLGVFFPESEGNYTWKRIIAEDLFGNINVSNPNISFEVIKPKVLIENLSYPEKVNISDEFTINFTLRSSLAFLNMSINTSKNFEFLGAKVDGEWERNSSFPIVFSLPSEKKELSINLSAKEAGRGNFSINIQGYKVNYEMTVQIIVISLQKVSRNT